MATYQQMIMSPLVQGKYKLGNENGNDQDKFEGAQMSQGINFGRALTDATPEERQFLSELAQKGGQADAWVLDEMTRLRERGDDLANVDQAYMDRAYRPAYERLMEDFNDMDRRIIEDMTRRGIVSQGSSADNGTGVAGSEPEMYQRELLARTTKRELGRNILEAQNQAVQQKLAQYQARLAETEQANTRFGQVQAPVIGANVTDANTRMQTRANAGTTMAGQKLGYAAQLHNTNTQRKIAGQDQMLGGIGMGLNFAGKVAQAAASAKGMKGGG